MALRLDSAQAIATTTEEAFRTEFCRDAGVGAAAGRPGHGRALALELHRIAVTAGAKVAEMDAQILEQDIGALGGRNMVASSPALDREAPGVSSYEAQTLEKLVDRIENRDRKRKARRAVGSRSSSSSSSGSFDLKARLAGQQFAGFPVWGLPETTVIRKLYRQIKGHKATYVASKPFEHWVRAHVGSGMPVKERRAVVQRYERECTREMSKLSESVQCFWLAHAVVQKCIPPSAVQAHLAVLARLRSEYDLEFVVQYERYLHADILEASSCGKDIDFMAVLGSLQLHIIQRLGVHRVRRLESRGSSSGQHASSQFSLPDSRSGGKGGGKGSKNREAQPAATMGKGTSSQRRPPLCLAHDLAKGKSCPDASNGKCRMEHVDTRKPEEAQRYHAVERIVDARRARQDTKRKR